MIIIIVIIIIVIIITTHCFAYATRGALSFFYNQPAIFNPSLPSVSPWIKRVATIYPVNHPRPPYLLIAPSAPPRAVTVVTVKQGNSSSVSVTWEPPPSDMQNGVIQDYKVASCYPLAPNKCLLILTHRTPQHSEYYYHTATCLSIIHYHTVNRQRVLVSHSH